MNNSTPENTTIPVWKRRWFRVCTVISALFIITLVVTPVVINKALKSWLLDNGADYVAIKNIDFNPFTGTASVYDLDVKIDNKHVLENSLVHLDISLSALFKKGLAVDSATLNGLKLDIEQSSDGKLRIGSLLFDPAEKSDEETIEDIEKKLAWWLQLSNIKLKDCLIRYRSPDLSADLYINNLSLHGINTKNKTQSARVEFDGRYNKSAIKADINLQQLSPDFRADGDFNLSQIKLDEFSGLMTDVLDTLKGTVNSSGKFTVSLSESGSLDVDYTGKTDINSTEISSSVFSAATNKLTYDGKIVLSQKSKGNELNLSLLGAMKGEGLSASAPDNIDVQGSASWKGNLSYNENGNSSIRNLKLGGDISFNHYRVKLTDMDIDGQETRWTGQLDFAESVEKSNDNPPLSPTRDIKLNGQLNASNVNLNLPSEDLTIRQQSINLKPQLSLLLNNKQTTITGMVDVLAEGSEIHDTENKRLLLGVSSLTIPAISLTSIDNINIPAASIKGSRFLQEAGSELPAFSISNSEITELSFQTNTVSIKQIIIDKLSGDIVRLKNGEIKLNQQNQIAETDTNQENKAVSNEIKSADSSENMAIIISELLIKDHSVINFTDQSVAPPFVSSLDIDSLQLNNINSSNPGQALQVKLDAKLNNYAKLTVRGTASPFLKDPAVNLKIKLANQNMVTLSPYVIETTGYLIRSGQLDIDSSIAIKDGNIDADNKLFIKKLRLDEADKNAVNEHAGSIGMPLDKALGMLRDKRDNIKLDLPISGKLDEINFGTGQILNTALKKATTAGMKTYLLYAFQPYGALIIAGQAVGKQVGKIYLDPVMYDAGQSDLNDKHKDYLKKLGKVLQDRPKLDVQICARTTLSDLSLSSSPKSDDAKQENKKLTSLSKAQIKKSKTLGLARQKAIKDFLISDFKINDGRLILCEPKVDKDTQAKPRVELLL